MIEIMRSDPAATREALESFEHADAGPFMLVQIEAVRAFISLLEGATPDLDTLVDARRPLTDYDLYRSALGFLRTALEAAKRTSGETERIFEVVRYQPK
jgi:hypothetical protein